MASYDFDASPDFDVLLEEVSEIAAALKNRNTDLEWLWFDIRNNIIDVVTRTIGLGLFTSIAAISLYIVISKKWKDGVSAIILVSVLPDCMSQFGLWLAMLSRLAQMYSAMYANILDTSAMAASIPPCILNYQCGDEYSPKLHEPEYTSHRCFGTAFMAADPLMHAAVVCVSTAVFLLHRKKFGLVTGSLLFTPLLAAFVSAAMHVRSACLPETVVDEDGNIEYVTADWSDWEVFNPKAVNDITARLALLTRVIPLLLVVYHFWSIRDAIRVQIGDSEARRRWTYWLAVTYVLPALVTEGWRSLGSAYNSEEDPYMPVLKYAVFSAGDAILVPLMMVYPGLALLVQKIWHCTPEGHREDAPAQEKLDTSASAPSPSASDDTKNDDTALLAT
ncbi:hypothetical protein TRAPUB_4958 [Trametes pubescens]|uniref:Uncharacterized protein n=1 Tax=Trametes pubescens TaxID=154538 RepID=A0A1M2V9N9_TRAPU|nr:hypothetical protein TRAPUB_4958 [Trametes pubescens]